MSTSQTITNPKRNNLQKAALSILNNNPEKESSASEISLQDEILKTNSPKESNAQLKLPKQIGHTHSQTYQMENKPTPIQTEFKQQTFQLQKQITSQTTQNRTNSLQRNNYLDKFLGRIQQVEKIPLISYKENGSINGTLMLQFREQLKNNYKKNYINNWILSQKLNQRRRRSPSKSPFRNQLN